MACAEVSQPPRPRATRSPPRRGSRPRACRRRVARRARRARRGGRPRRRPDAPRRVRSHAAAKRGTPGRSRRRPRGHARSAGRCPVRSSPPRGGRSDQALVHRLRAERLGLTFELLARRGVGPRELEVVDHRAEVEARAADQQRPAAAAGDARQRPARRVPESERRRTPRRDPRGPSDGAARLPLLGVGLAVPTSMPRYTSIESTETISAPDPRRARGRPRSCRTRSDRPARGAAPSLQPRRRPRPRRRGGAPRPR